MFFIFRFEIEKRLAVWVHRFFIGLYPSYVILWSKYKVIVSFTLSFFLKQYLLRLNWYENLLENQDYFEEKIQCR